MLADVGPGVPYLVPAHEIVVTFIQQRGQGAKKGPIEFIMLLKNERGEELLGEYQLSDSSSGGAPQVNTVMVSMKPMIWSKRN